MLEIINSNNLKIITIKDKEFPAILKTDENCPFCIVVSNKFTYDLNNKFVYIYYSKYFSKIAEEILKYNYKIIKENNTNVISEYENIDSIKIDYLENYLNNVNIDNSSIKINNHIYFVNKNSNINTLINLCIIIEARYEKYIVDKVDYFAEKSIPILVFPNSILNKNSYFSNYLIKQGADIILGKNDLIFTLNSLSC